MLGQVNTPLASNHTEEVRRYVQRLLGRSVDDEEPLMEAGLDSLGAMELRTELSRVYEMELSSTIIFDHPTIKALAKHLASVVAPIRQVPSLPFSQPAASRGLFPAYNAYYRPWCKAFHVQHRSETIDVTFSGKMSHSATLARLVDVYRSTMDALQECKD